MRTMKAQIGEIYLYFCPVLSNTKGDWRGLYPPAELRAWLSSKPHLLHPVISGSDIFGFLGEECYLPEKLLRHHSQAFVD